MTIADNLLPLATPLGDLHLLEGNPRRGDVDAVARSLERFGQLKPIVARTDGTVIAGNHTLLAARQLGWTELAVVRTDHDEATAKAFALADNRTSELGTYDEQALLDLLNEVNEADPTLLISASFAATDLDDLLARLTPLPAPLDDPDAVPTSAPAVTMPGDVWLLGPHRLVCGDARNPAALDRLLGRAVPAAILTDPPYGQNQPGVPGDSPEEHRSLLEGLARCPGTLAIVFQSPRGFPVALDALRHDGWTFERMLWLYKEAQNSYPWRGWLLTSEAILVFSRGDVSTWQDEHPYTHDCYKLSEVSGELSNGLWHGSVKPFSVVSDLLRRTTPLGGTVLDPFIGSGTTLIAAHMHGRTAYGMEISPGYCDIVCKRFQQTTGVLPISESTGHEHDFCEG